MTTQRRTILAALAGLFAGRSARSEPSPSVSPIIDDLSAQPPGSTLGTEWRLFTDTVMGGVSQATMTRETIDGRKAIRLQGEVSLDNNGGFVQISLDFRQDGGPLDASAWRGIEVEVFGNGEDYAANLRTWISTVPGNPIVKSSGPTPFGAPSNCHSISLRQVAPTSLSMFVACVEWGLSALVAPFMPMSPSAASDFFVDPIDFKIHACV